MEKAIITNTLTGQKIPVMFNPEEYTLNREINYAQSVIPGLSGPVLQFVSGFLLWMTKPTQYVVDIAFVLKFLLVIVGIVLTLYLYRTVNQDAAPWNVKGTASSRAVTLGIAALLVWSVVLVVSRLTAHLGSI